MVYIIGKYWINLYTIHPNNNNNVHKDSNDLLSVIFILGTDFHSGETVFNMELNMNDIWERAHGLNNSHIMCVVGAFDKIWHHRAVLSLILQKSTLLHFVNNVTNFYDKYIYTDDRKKYIDYDGSGIFQKQKDRKLYNAKYQNTCGNKCHVVSVPYI